MFKDRRTYIDYNGVERTEDFYFNLTEAEVIDMELGTEGGLGEMIQKIVAAQDQGAILRIFKDVVFKAYGEKSPDGKRFIKSKELSEAYFQTAAFNDMFMEIATDENKLAAFINGITPNVDTKNVTVMDKDANVITMPPSV